MVEHATQLAAFPDLVWSDDEDPRQTWRTPRALGRSLVRRYGLTIDLAACADNALCPNFLTRQQDSLSLSWAGVRGWCNPPFGNLRPFLAKALKASASQRAVVVMILPAHVGTSWFTEYAPRCEWWAFDKRVAYEPPPGIKKSSPAFGSVLFVFDRNTRPGFGGILDHKTGEVSE